MNKLAGLIGLILILCNAATDAVQQPRTKFVGVIVNPCQNNIEIDRTIKWLDRNYYINTIMIPVQTESLAHKSKYYPKDFWGSSDDRDQVEYICKWAVNNKKYIIFYIHGPHGIKDKIDGKPSKIVANHQDFNWVTQPSTALNEYGFNYGFVSLDNWSMVRYFSDLARELTDKFQPYAIVMNTGYLNQQIVDPKCSNTKSLKMEEEFIKMMVYQTQSKGVKIGFTIPSLDYQLTKKGQLKSYSWTSEGTEKLRWEMYSKYSEIIVGESMYIPLFVLASKESAEKIVNIETDWITLLKQIAQKRPLFMFCNKRYKDLEKQTYYPRELGDKDYKTMGRVLSRRNVDGLLVCVENSETEQVRTILDYFEIKR